MTSMPRRSRAASRVAMPAAARFTAAEPAIAGFSLAPAREVGADLAVTLRLASPGPRRARENGPAVNRAAAGIATRLAARLRRGIEVIVAG